MCGVRHPTCNPANGRKLIVSCQSGDVAASDESAGATGYITYNDLPNDEKAMTVDDDGRAWVLTVDNKIYYAWGKSWKYWHGVYDVVDNGCADQIAVIGGISNPSVMLRGCDRSVTGSSPVRTPGSTCSAP